MDAVDKMLAFIVIIIICFKKKNEVGKTVFEILRFKSVKKWVGAFGLPLKMTSKTLCTTTHQAIYENLNVLMDLPFLLVGLSVKII